MAWMRMLEERKCAENLKGKCMLDVKFFKKEKRGEKKRKWRDLMVLGRCGSFEECDQQQQQQQQQELDKIIVRPVN